MPELRRLRAFVAVAEELNFTRAAERLHLGQQAVSKSVGQLERELGVELLERTTREVRLTPAGVALLESGRAALTAADAAFDRARAVGRGLAGTVRIGATPAIGPGTREQVVRALRDDAPELSLSFREVRPDEVAQLLRDRVVDLVLARTSRDAPDVDSAALRPSPVELLVPAGHRLAGAASARLAELDGERLLTWSAPGTPYTDLLVNRLRAAGARVEPVESRVTGGGSLELTETGAVALAPAGFPTGEHSTRVPIEDDITLPLLVLWPAGLPSPAVRRLRAAMSLPPGRGQDVRRGDEIEERT
jgi:DNA-binding transcriptional LysR family regulator